MKQNNVNPQRRDSPRKRRRAAHQARISGTSAPRKASHILPPEQCVLFVQGVGYVSDYVPRQKLVFVDLPELARVCCGGIAPRVAMAIRSETGMSVSVRAYRPQPDGSFIESLKRAH